MYIILVCMNYLNLILIKQCSTVVWIMKLKKKKQISIKTENPTIHKQVYLVNHKSYENRHKMASFEPRYMYEYRIM